MEFQTIENEMIELAKKIDETMNVNFYHGDFTYNSPSGLHSTSNGITLRWENIISNVEYLKEKNPKINVHDVAWSIFTHELGHRIDFLETKFSSFNKSNDVLWKFLLEGDIKGIKENFKPHFKNLIALEEKAWVHAEEILPDFVNKEIFFFYKEHCLDNYRNSFRIEYRRFRLKAQISGLIRDFFFLSNFKLVFSDFEENYFDSENQIYHFNVSNYCRRNRTFVGCKPDYIECSIHIIETFLDLFELDYPIYCKTNEQVELWRESSFEQLESLLPTLEKYFHENKEFIHIYESEKRKEIQFTFETKINFLEKQKSKSVV